MQTLSELGLDALAILDQSPAVTYVSCLEPEARLQFVSQSVRSVLGYAPEQFVDQPGFLTSLLHPDDVATLKESLDTALAYGSAVRDRRIKTASGNYRWFRDHVRLIRGNDGRPRYGVGTIVDVTDEKAAHQALEAKTAEYRVLAEHSSDLISRVTLDGRFVYQSPSARRLMGFGGEERVGNQSFDQIHPDDYPALGEAWKAVVRSKQPRMLRYRAFHADGRWITFEAAINPVLDPETGRVAEFVIVSRDITDRIEQERCLADARAELEEQGETYGLFARHASDFFMRLALDGRMLHVSASHERILGRQALLRDGRLADVVYPEDLESTRAAWRQALETRSTGSFRNRVRHERGHLVWLETQITPIMAPDGDNIAEMIAVSRDVTAQVEAEYALALANRRIEEQSELYDLFASRGSEIFLRFTVDGRALHVSPSHERVLGGFTLVKDGRVAHMVHPDDLEIATEAFTQAFETQRPQTYRHRYAHADGGWVWLEVTLTPLVSPMTGRVNEFIAVARDVGEQMEAEQALAGARAEAEDRARHLNLITESSPDIFARYRLDGVPIYVSSAYQRILGYEEHDLSAIRINDIIHVEDTEAVVVAWARLMDTRQTQEVRFRARHRDGHWIWLESQMSPIFDPATGELIEAISVCRDISGRIADEERLSKTQRDLAATARRLKFLSDNSADAIITADAQGILRSASGGVELIYGCTAEELVGQGMELVHPDDIHIAANAIESFARTRQPVSYRIRQKKRGHGYIWADHRANPVLDADGNLKAAVITVRNVDAEVEREQQLIAARRELEESRNRLELVTDNIADIVTVVRPDGGKAYMSPSVQQVLGYTADEMIAAGFAEIVHPDDRAMTDAEQAQNRLGIVTPQMTYRVRRRDGVYVWIERRARAIADHDFGDGVAVLSVIRDMTAELEYDRRIVETSAALKESSERLRLVTDNIADVISLFRPDGSVAYMSPSAEKLTGYTPEEMGRFVPGQIMHPEDRDMILEEVARNRNGEIAPLLRYRIIHKDGRTVWFERRACAVTEHDFGPGVAVLTIISDITQKVAQEEELSAAWAAHEESRVRLQSIMDNSIDVIAVFGPDRTLEYLSKSSEPQSGYTVEEFFAGSAVLAHPDDEEAVREAVERERVTGEGSTFRYRGVRKDGSVLWLERRGRIVYDAAGALRYVVTVTRDISDQVRHEQDIAAANAQLERAKLAAEAASVAKSQFLATMSHELRTPMTGVMGMLDLMQGTGLTGEQARYATLAYESADNLLSILNDILDFSKIEAGQMQILREPFSLSGEIGKVVGLLTPIAEKKGDTLNVEIDGALPDALIGDGPRIRQVLFNLLGNAVKFTAEGRIEISARPAGTDAAPRIRFAVADTGPGVPADAQARLFRPFVQGDGSTTRKAGGTGLGLAISKSLVEAMGGTIGFDSTEGQGSTFWFELPLAAAQPATAQAAAPAPAIARPRRRFDILVAEDHPVNQQLIAALLKREGHTITMVGNGKLAVEAVQNRSFDLVLMDVQMPVMDGTAATRAIRALTGPVSQIPIVAITANALRGDMETYLQAGMTGYVSKPIKIDALRDAMERAVPFIDEEPPRLAG